MDVQVGFKSLSQERSQAKQHNAALPAQTVPPGRSKRPPVPCGTRPHGHGGALPPLHTQSHVQEGTGEQGVLLTPQQIFPVLASKKAGGDVSHMETGPMDQQHKISIYNCFFSPELFFMRFPFAGAKTAAEIRTQPS